MHAVIKRWLTFGWCDDSDGPSAMPRTALGLFEARGDERGLSRAWRLLADLDFQGELANAERKLERALVHARNAGDVGEQTEIYSSLGAHPVPRAYAGRRDDPAMRGGPRGDGGEPDDRRTMYHPMAHMKARQR